MTAKILDFKAIPDDAFCAFIQHSHRHVPIAILKRKLAEARDAQVAAPERHRGEVEALELAIASLGGEP
jgi:hypothetical protein